MTRALSAAPADVRRIARTLEEAGHETWAVGGAVRNVLMGLPAGDWDLTTHAPPAVVRRLFRRTVPLGIDHGTVGVLAPGGAMYEVTTFRRDVETDGRHAVVRFADTVLEDLARRDFTINAIAWHPLREELLDPHGGQADLAAGVLRTVGDPSARFGEDYLRVLRALRFAGRFRLSVDGTTWDALCRAVPMLPRLSAERIREELLKVLQDDPAPSTALGLHQAAGVLEVLYPELATLAAGAGAGRVDAWRVAVATADVLPRGRPLLRLAGLLRDVPREDAAALLTRLRLSNTQADETAHLAAAPPVPEAGSSDVVHRRWLSRVGRARWRSVVRLDLARHRALGGLGAEGDAAGVVAAWRRLRDVLRSSPPLVVADLRLDGRDLIGMGLRPGPRFGRILEALLDWVLEDPTRNETPSLRRRVEELERGGADE